MKVSIIVSVYNIEDFIEGCINSLINQTYSNIEIILVDDGSTDGSSDVCDKIERNDNRIKVIHKENGGLSSARNAGLDIATGDFVMFIDGDDYLVENAVEILMNIQKQYNSDIVQFEYEETEHKYYRKMDVEKPNPICVDDMRMMYDKLYELGGCAASACTKIYKSKIFEGLRFKEGIRHEDEQVVPFVIQRANKIVYIKNKLYCYYMRSGSIIKSGFNIRKLDIFDILKERMDILKSLGYSDLIEKENHRYFTSLVYFYADARNANNNEACAKLKQLMRVFIKDNTVKVSGYMKLIRLMCKLNTNFIATYYWMKKILHKR